MQPSRIKISLPPRSVAGRSALAAILAGALLLSTASRADDSAPSGGPGTWQSHKYTFQFLGFTSTYSCDGLADKLRPGMSVITTIDATDQPVKESQAK